MRNPAEVIQALCSRILPPPPVLTVSEWADRERILGPEESSEPGRWRTDRTPYLREIQDSISDASIRTVVVMSSARVGKTSGINNAIAYFIVQDPSPMLMVLPTVDLGKSWSKEQLAPMLRNTPALRGAVAEAKSRDSNNSIQMKVFNGGYIAVAGANSPNGLSSRTCRVVIFDEVDKITAAAGDFGSPIELGKKRTTTYPGRYKHILTSTPGIKGESTIEAEFQKGDQCRYHVPCPHCGTFDHLWWDNMKWPDGHPEEAVYVCPHCQGQITDAHKPAMLAAGKWVASCKAAVPGTRSFHLNEIYSPWVPFSQMAINFVQKNAAGPESLKTFIQESLGETWDDHKDQETKVSALLARARKSPYSSGQIPDDVAYLVASTDTQDDRIEAMLMGIGAGGTRYVIEHVVLPGNLALPDIWDDLENYVNTPRLRMDGGEMKIRKICLDTGGHFEKQVTAFTRRPSMVGIAVPIKGSSRPMKKWVAPSKKRSKLMLVDTVAVKRAIYNALKIEDPKIPGYIWFPNDLEQSFFDQLMSEHLVKTANTWKYESIIKGSRNEAIDLCCYAKAAGSLLGSKPEEIVAQVEWFKRTSKRKAKPAPPPVAPTPETAQPEPEPEEPPILTAKERYLLKMRAKQPINSVPVGSPWDESITF